MKKLTYETVNGTNTIETATALQMLLSLENITYINISLNEDIRATMAWLCDDMHKLRGMNEDSDVYAINEGSAVFKCRYADGVATFRMITTGHLVARFIQKSVNS